MTKPAGAAAPARKTRSPWRDIVLLPAIGILTIGLLAVSSEAIARRMFPDLATSVQRGCMIMNDPSTGVRAVPDSVCRDRIPEGDVTEYRFNSMGHRAGMELVPKSPGTYRIVLLGSSFVLGLGVPQEKTFAALLPVQLSHQTGRPVELYNEGMMWGSPHSVALRFNDALAAQPDLILWALTPWDIENASMDLPVDPGLAARVRIELAHRAKASFWTRVRSSIASAVETNSIPRMLRDHFNRTRSALMLQHFLYESQSQYVKLYLMSGDDAGFLKDAPDDQWQNRLRQFDSYAAEVEARASAAGVPLVTVLLPQRAQAAMASMGEWRSGYNPYRLDDALREIVAGHGGTYVSILPDYRAIPNSEQYYLPVDGHPDTRGHSMLSGLLARELTKGTIRELSAPAHSQAELEQER
jgi:hypothetical protein